MTGLKPASEASGIIPKKFWPAWGAEGMFYQSSVNAIVGPSGMGKSIASQKIVADVSKHIGPVIYCNAEDGEAIQRYRFDAAGGNLDNIFLGGFQIPEQLDDLHLAILTHKAVMVVFDTAEKHIAVPQSKWGRALADLNEVCAKTECASVLIHHANKTAKAGMDWRAAVGGPTSGLTGTVRSLILFGVRKDNPEQRIFCPVKDNYGPVNAALALDINEEEYTQPDGETISIAHAAVVETDIWLDNPVELVVIQSTGKGKKGPPAEAVAEANDFLVKALADGPVPVSPHYRCNTNPDSSMKHGDKDWPSRECGWLAKEIVNKEGGVCPDCGGTVTEHPGLKLMAEDASISWHTVKRSKAKLELESGKKGSPAQGRGLSYWMLAAGHPKLNPGALDYMP